MRISQTRNSYKTTRSHDGSSHHNTPHSKDDDPPEIVKAIKFLADVDVAIDRLDTESFTLKQQREAARNFVDSYRDYTRSISTTLDPSPKDIVRFLSSPSAQASSSQSKGLPLPQRISKRRSTSSSIVYIGRHPSVYRERPRSVNTSDHDPFGPDVEQEDEEMRSPSCESTSSYDEDSKSRVRRMIEAKLRPRVSIQAPLHHGTRDDPIMVVPDRRVTRSQAQAPAPAERARSASRQSRQSTSKTDIMARAPIPQRPAHGTVVWAKAETYPWWPAVLHGESARDIPEKVLDSRAEAQAKFMTGIENLFAVQFFDESTDWAWLPREKLRLLGVDDDVDEELLQHQKWHVKNGKAQCRTAFQDAFALKRIHNRPLRGGESI